MIKVFKTRILRPFLRPEDGAATVDFVVVCGAVVLMAVIVSSVVRDGTHQMAENVGDVLSDTEVATGM